MTMPMPEEANQERPAHTRPSVSQLGEFVEGTLPGMISREFELQMFGQIQSALWLPRDMSAEDKAQAYTAALDTLIVLEPRDASEVLLAVQMIGTHNAAMECLRRSMIEDQPPANRDINLKHAAKFMDLYDRQLAAFDKRRGKGQQRITVEHVTVEAGGQAIVGDVSLAAKANDTDLEAPSLDAEALPLARKAKAGAPRRGKAGR